MFAALVPPADAAEHLDEFLAVRRAAGAFRWAPLDQFHVTLAFYASVPDRSLDDLVERLGRAAVRRTAVATALAGGGAFPNAVRARVLWVGLDLAAADRREVGLMSDGARAAASRAGVAVDGQRFRAHLTLARIGRPAEASSWVRLLDGYRGPAWTADTVTLLASYLGEGPRRRPRYEIVAELPVGRTSPDQG